MDLGIAGMISGAGNAGTASLAATQHYLIASKLQEERDKHDDLRAERLMEHQTKLQQGTQSFTAAEGDKTRAAHSADITTQTAAHSADTKATLQNAKEMNAATNATHLLTAKLQRQMQEKQFDKTFTTAKLSALKDTVRELGNEITRLSVVVANPLADKMDPSYKSAVIQLESATKLHNLYAKQVGLEMKIDEGTIDKTIETPKAPTITDPFRTNRTPGLIQVPPPSAVEQKSMADQIQ